MYILAYTHTCAHTLTAPTPTRRAYERMRATASEAALREFLLAFKTHAPTLEQLRHLLVRTEQEGGGGGGALRRSRPAFFEQLAQLRAGQHAKSGGEEAVDPVAAKEASSGSGPAGP